MAPVGVESALVETASSSGVSRRFDDLRGVQWRIDLGILPSSRSASIDDLRRVTANSRRGYAALRKQLLVDPHVMKDGCKSPDPVMDNPLSQNPDSMWSRFFRNAELERMVDQDLTRLYPERGGYFQSSGCQIMLRRILLLWCLKHPDYGYRQGMHELLAPLLYVLHVDIQRLSEVRKANEDHFADKFDGFLCHENDLMYKLDFKKFTEYVRDSSEDENCSVKVSSLAELDPATQTIVLLSDAYGAEGELGVVLSEKFMEHDAYVMFDTLMSGAGGVVCMAEFFSPSPYSTSHSGFPPVIEASATIYRLLFVVDSSLHSHLVELGVEPQYFSLRWLRVLFGREFSLENLLLIWDEIFARDNRRSIRTADSKAESSFGILDSPRGAFISAFAVSMMLQLRSSLLASDNATACLQKLLNFPEDADLGKMVAKAKSLQALALETNGSSSPLYHGVYDGKTPMFSRCRSLGPSSPKTPLNVVPDSYWEEKWRVLHEAEERKRLKASIQESESGQEVPKEKLPPSTKRAWSEKVKLRLSRTVSDLPLSKKNGKAKIPKPFKRNLLEDLSQQILDEHRYGTTPDNAANRRSLEVNREEKNAMHNDVENQEDGDKISSKASSAAGIGEKFYIFSGASSPFVGNSDQENDSEISSVASNSSVYDNNVEPCETHMACLLPISDIPDGGDSLHSNHSDDSARQSVAVVYERNRSLSSRFQRLWKFGRASGEGTTCDRSNVSGDAKGCYSGSEASTSAASLAIGDDISSKGETVDQNLILNLRNLGQSMIDNIQVIESVFQQDPENSKNWRQISALSALKELRKISNILTEM